MRRRALALAAVVALGLVPGAAQAARTPLPKCLSFADPVGDTQLRGSSALGDQALDVRSVTLGVRGDEMVGTIRLVAMAERPKYAWGDRFQFSFLSGSDTVGVFHKRSATRSAEEHVVIQQGVTRNGHTVTTSGVTALYDAGTSTVTLAVKLRTLRETLGRGLENTAVSAVSVDAVGSYVLVHQTWDNAAPRRETTMRVTGCA